MYVSNVFKLKRCGSNNITVITSLSKAQIKNKKNQRNTEKSNLKRNDA